MRLLWRFMVVLLAAILLVANSTFVFSILNQVDPTPQQLQRAWSAYGVMITGLVLVGLAIRLLGNRHTNTIHLKDAPEPAAYDWTVAVISVGGAATMLAPAVPTLTNMIASLWEPGEWQGHLPLGHETILTNGFLPSQISGALIILTAGTAVRAANSGIIYISERFEHIRNYIKVVINPDYVAQWRRMTASMDDRLFNNCWQRLEEIYKIVDCRKGLPWKKSGSPNGRTLLILSRKRSLPDQIEEIEKAPIAEADQIIFAGRNGAQHGWFAAEPFQAAMNEERPDRYKTDLQVLAAAIVQDAPIREHRQHLPLAQPQWALLKAADKAGQSEYWQRYLPSLRNKKLSISPTQKSLTKELDLAVFDTSAALALIAADNPEKRLKIDLDVSISPSRDDD